MKKKGFTLIELMITIAVIGLLAAIALPRFAGVTEDAKVANVQGNLASLRTATQMYMAKNGEVSVHDMFRVRAENETGTGYDDITDDFYKSFYGKKKIPVLPTGENLSKVKAGVTYVSDLEDNYKNANAHSMAYIIDTKDDEPATYINIYAYLDANTYGANINWREF